MRTRSFCSHKVQVRIVIGCLLAAFLVVRSHGDVTGWVVDPSSNPRPLHVDDLTPGAQVDQQQTASTGGGMFSASRSFAQTFRPEISGFCVGVDFYGDNWDFGPVLPAQVSIAYAPHGSPTDGMLKSVTSSWKPKGWLTVDFGPSGVFLQAEQIYALIVQNDDVDPDVAPNDGLGIEWYDDMYPRGSLWSRGNQGDWVPFHPFSSGPTSDLMFRTWMIVPEPSACAGLIVCAATLLRRRECEES